MPFSKFYLLVSYNEDGPLELFDSVSDFYNNKLNLSQFSVNKLLSHPDIVFTNSLVKRNNIKEKIVIAYIKKIPLIIHGVNFPHYRQMFIDNLKNQGMRDNEAIVCFYSHLKSLII